MNNKFVYLLAAISLGLGVYLASVLVNTQSTGDDPSQKTQYANWYPEARALHDFSLTDHKGDTMTNESLLGHWTLAFVGYTFCPDICPVTLAEINKVYPELSELKTTTPVKVWFLSVDPKRDNTERLSEYINYFNPDFVASSGPHTELFPLVRSMGMMYATSESTDNPNYLVDHSASVVVINPLGQVVARFKPTLVPGQLPVSNPDQILHDMPIIMGV